MNKESFFAFSFTLLLFGGAGVYLFGTPSWTMLPEVSLGNLFSEKEPATERKIKKSKKKRKATKRKKDSRIATVIDKFKGVNIYFNGRVANVNGRSVTKDGYNLGLKYQCVEFVKRYYYERFHHKMPDSYGHAKDFFDHSLASAVYNSTRGLIQYRNNAQNIPVIDDILVFGGNQYNSYGHVAIISDVKSDHIEIVQQNPGPKNSSRAIIPMVNHNGTWELRGADILGWLRR